MEQVEERELTPEEYQAEKDAILDRVKNPSKYSEENNDDVKLPSEENQEEEQEERIYANSFKNVTELRKGIDNLGSNLPDYVLEGMNDDALEKHYIELRKEFSSRKQEKPEDKSEKPSDNISDDLWSGLEATYAETGDITPEQRAELNKSGIPDKMIDGYLEGLKAQAKASSMEQEQFTNNIYELAGGKEEYETIKAWAEENYSQAELNAIASGSYDEIYFKMKGIKADYIAKNGAITADRLRGGNTNRGGDSYRSQQEYLTDRMDRRYKTDAKYRAKVNDKFKNSTFGS